MGGAARAYRSPVHRRWADQPGGLQETNEASWRLLRGGPLLFCVGRPLCQGDQAPQQGHVKVIEEAMSLPYLCCFFRLVLVSTVSS